MKEKYLSYKEIYNPTGNFKETIDVDIQKKDIEQVASDLARLLQINDCGNQIDTFYTTIVQKIDQEKINPVVEEQNISTFEQEKKDIINKKLLQQLGNETKKELIQLFKLHEYNNQLDNFIKCMKNIYCYLESKLRHTYDIWGKKI